MEHKLLIIKVANLVPAIVMRIAAAVTAVAAAVLVNPRPESANTAKTIKSQRVKVTNEVSTRKAVVNSANINNLENIYLTLRGFLFMISLAEHATFISYLQTTE